jgi:hypothetical protein
MKSEKPWRKRNIEKRININVKIMAKDNNLKSSIWRKTSMAKRKQCNGSERKEMAAKIMKTINNGISNIEKMKMAKESCRNENEMTYQYEKA